MADEPNLYICTAPGCDKRFHSFNVWMEHKRVCHPDDQVAAPVNQREGGTVRPDPDGRWSCPWCERDVGNFDLLAGHLKVCQKYLYDYAKDHPEASAGRIDLMFWQIERLLSFETWLHNRGIE